MRLGGAIFAAALACRALAFAEGSAGTYEVEGACLVSQEGMLFIYAVDEDSFDSPMKGFRESRLRVGPAEPWGMSWREERRDRLPRFGDIAFAVDRDIRGLVIEVRR